MYLVIKLMAAQMSEFSRREKRENPKPTGEKKAKWATDEEQEAGAGIRRRNNRALP